MSSYPLLCASSVCEFDCGHSLGPGSRRNLQVDKRWAPLMYFAGDRVNGQDVQCIALSQRDGCAASLCDGIEEVATGINGDLENVSDSLQFEMLYLDRLKREGGIVDRDTV